MSKEAVIASIIATTQAFAPGSDPVGMIGIASRESGFVVDAVGDKHIGLSVYEKELPELLAMGNPFARDADLWANSIGLFQFMPAYYARLWAKTGNPQILKIVEPATVVAMRLWNKAVNAGAKNPVEVRLYWGYGPKGLKYGPGSKEYDDRLADEKKRYAKLGYSSNYATKSASSFGYGPAGTGEQPGQAAKVLALRGGDVVSPTDPEIGGAPVAEIMIAAITIGAIAWIAKK